MRASSLFPPLGPTLVLATLLAALAGCGGTPQTDQGQQPSKPPPASTTPGNEQATVLPYSAYSREFQAADAALLGFDWMSASVVLERLPAEELNQDDGAYLSYLEARIAHVRGDSSKAMAILQATEHPDLHPAIAYRVHNFQRHLLELRGDYLASAQLGSLTMTSAPAADQAGLKRSVWRNLQRLDTPALAQAKSGTVDAQWAAWLELAEIARGDLTSLGNDLPSWLATNSGHPASDPLPGGLQFLLAGADTPDTVALLLPLSGRLAPAGKAVRDGYLASYFKARAVSTAPAEVLVLNSDNYGSALDAYNDAILQGAKLVVGPLSKTSVGELATASRSVPVLALNQTDRSLSGTGSALVQFALSPTDEAAQLAELAFGAGARRAMILRPAGAWGDKMERALTQRWQRLGGSLASSVSYTGRDDYSGSVKSGLGLEAGEQRKQRVRDMLASNVEFTPRRRQDIDAIFMLSRNAPEARSIKPLLAFHYAGQIPVYAPSTVYSGSPDARDKDLDGINLVELPWLLEPAPSLKRELATSGSDQYTRLNALGVDAYLLQSRWVQLQGGPDALLRGDTGILTLNPQLQIERDLPLATFDGGELSPR